MAGDEQAADPKRLAVRNITAATVGNALEFYDFITYAFFAIQIGRCFFPNTNAYANLMLSLATFAAGFITRPIGGIIIGSYADRVGRRPAMILSFTLMGVAILALALIPSYRSIGVAAPILAVLARMVQDFALGCEVGPTTAYLVESAPEHRRGLLASWQSVSQSIANMVGGAVGVVLAMILSAGPLDEYGWRIAFFLGALTLPFGLIIRRSLPETLHEPDHLPINLDARSGFFGVARDHARAIIIGLLILMGGTVATYVLNYMTTFARTTLHMAASPSFAATLVNGLFGLIASLAGGWLSDLYGRRRLMLIPRFAFLFSVYPIFLLIVYQHSTMALLVGTALLSILLNISSGAFYVAFGETLPKRVRGGIFATVYATSIAVFGGTTQPIIAWLIHVTENPLAPAWYLLLATALSVIAMLMMVESAPVHLSKAESPGL